MLLPEAPSSPWVWGPFSLTVSRMWLLLLSPWTATPPPPRSLSPPFLFKHFQQHTNQTCLLSEKTNTFIWLQASLWFLWSRVEQNSLKKLSKLYSVVASSPPIFSSTVANLVFISNPTTKMAFSKISNNLRITKSSCQNSLRYRQSFPSGTLSSHGFQTHFWFSPCLTGCPFFIFYAGSLIFDFSLSGIPELSPLSPSSILTLS